MSVVSADTPIEDVAASARGRGLAAAWVLPALMAVGAFGLYWLSAVILQARDATLVFGNDSHLYVMLRDGTPVDRITRFHPLTTALAVGWMKLVWPLTAWLSPQVLYKGLFAAVGAAGVWAATAAFAAIGPRRQALLWGAAYAVSLGVWYFSSVEESKIVTATLVAFYIATYLRLRAAWSTRGFVVLTGVLLLGCLNEIVAAFLVAIPALDALVQHGWNIRTQLRRNWWIAAHALAAPVAFLLLELVVNGRLVPPGDEAEGASHLSMLLYYLLQRQITAAAVYDFATRWLLFNMAAPSIDASYGATDSYAGDFAPGLAAYLGAPVSAGLVAVFAAILVVSLLRPHRGQITRGMAGVMLGLAVYAVLRALFFFLIYPGEHMLFACGATLPHMLLIAMPFAVSTYPRKQTLLAVLAALLLVVNGSFILGE
jgi:hypothetical protein